MENPLSSAFRNARTVLAFLLFGMLCLAKANPACAIDCGMPGTCFEAASGVNSGVGAALDESKNRLYFVEYNAGTLKTVNLPPLCGPGTAIPSCWATETAFDLGAPQQLV